MPLLKDTEREQLRQLVKACLLEISKLKIELKKCQKESSKSADTESIQVQAIQDEFQTQIKHKDEKIAQINLILQEKDDEIKELEKIRVYFEAIIARPKKDLTSFLIL